jgi:uncharacterized membrane protein (DUF441 family)
VGAIVVFQLVTASVSELHHLSMGQERGVMIGVLLLTVLVLLVPLGSGGLVACPAHLPSEAAGRG